MDVGEMRGDLARTLAAIRRLDKREHELLRKAETLRRERDRLDAAVQSIAAKAERAQLEPQEYGLLFGDHMEAQITAALTRAL